MGSAESIHRLARRPVRFALVGIVNSLAGLAVIYLCKLAVGLGDVASNMVGYGVGLAVSFVLNSAWTFQYRGAMIPAALRYVLVFLVSYGANLALVLHLIDAWSVDSYVAQAAGILPYTLVFYALSKAVVFRPSREPA
jgi:putative flippase GtrA